MKKKIVGIIARPDKNEYQRNIFKINETVRTSICEFDIVPLVIVPKSTKNYLGKREINTDLDDLKPVLDMCDGFIMQGGFGPYDYDFYIVDYAYQNNKPFLGICLGMQVMGIYLGGKTKSILKNTIHGKKKNFYHQVNIKKDSYLYKIIQKEKIIVNSRHSEMLTDIDKSYIVASNNGIIEAIEDQSKKFFIGVQWHPEDLKNKNLFKGFVNKL